MNEESSDGFQPSQNHRPILAAVVIGTIAATVWLLAFAAGKIDIGVPGEWLWKRQSIGVALDIAIPIGTAVIVIAAYLAIIRYFSRRIGSSSRAATLIIPAVAMMSFFLLWAIQTCAPSPHRQLKPNWILYDWGASGYFDEARKVESLRAYFDNYEAEMAKGEVLHKGTHPPGLVVANFGLLRICRDSDSTSNAILATMPDSVATTFGELVPDSTLPKNDRAALWLSVILTHLIAAFAVVPLYLLLRRDLDAQRSLLVVSLWPLIPGLAVFLPKSDALYPLIGSLFLWLGIAAWEKDSIFRAAASALVFWIGMMLSLAMLPFAALAGIYSLLRWKQHGPNRKQATKFICGFGGSFVGATAVFYAVTGIRLWKTWVMNFHNHAGFYEQFERTYSKWLIANPLELALTVGAPVLVMAVVGATLIFRKEARTQSIAPVSVLIVWALLWLSGKNMGEAARLWLLLTPMFIWASGSIFSQLKDDALFRTWWIAALCQTVVCILTATIVNGFSF